MRRLGKMTRNESALAVSCKVVALAIFLVCLCTMVVDTSQAQQIPRRLNTLQLIKPMTPPPVPPVERLRRDIIRAINPSTGTIDPSQIIGPIPRGRPWLDPASATAGTGSQIGGRIPPGRPGLYPQLGTSGEGSQVKGRIPSGRNFQNRNEFRQILF